jgi:Autotransporter beta-domain.
LALGFLFTASCVAHSGDLNVFGGGGGGGSDYGKTGGLKQGGAGGDGGHPNTSGGKGYILTTAHDVLSYGGGGGGGYAGMDVPGTEAQGGSSSLNGAAMGGTGSDANYNGGMGGNNDSSLLINGVDSSIGDGENLGGKGGVAVAGGANGGAGGGYGGIGVNINSVDPANPKGAAGGGGGGTVDYRMDDVAVDNVSVFAGSGGQAILSGGGGGGNAVLRSAGTVTVQTITLNGGKGGDGGYHGGSGGSLDPSPHLLGGGGGGGGAMYEINGATVTAGTVTLTAGNGGEGLTGYGGGGGGGHVAIVGDGTTMTVTGTLTLQAGTGGASANGGAGGDARFSVTNLDAKAVTVKSGVYTAGLGAAGNASFAVGTLKTQNAAFNQQTGSVLGVSIAELGVSTQSEGGTMLTFSNTDSSRTAIGTITFNQAAALRIDATSQAALRFDVIRVSGTGSTYAAASTFNLDATGKTMYFDLTGVNKNETMLFANGNLTIDNTTDVVLTNIGSGSSVAVGDTYTLVDSATINSWTERRIETEGGAMQYEYVVARDGSNLVTRLDKANINVDKGKSLVMGAAARSTLLYDSGNLMFESAIPNAVGMIRTAAMTGYPRKVVFAAASWAENEFDTGSHIKAKNANATIGLAVPCVAGVGIGAFGPFIEGGYGDYDAHNFDGYNSRNIVADGDTYHFGGGFFGRFDFNAGLFVEASVRGGRIVTDYKTNDMGDSRVEFDSGTWYAGGHAGLGWNICFDECNTWIPYAYGMAFRQGKDKYHTNFGDVIDVDNADSLRMRAGLRYTHRFGGDGVKVYVGGAWEREFKGAVKADVNGMKLTNYPTFRGDSAMAEIGAKWNCGTGWEFDIGARGFLGRREGFSVNAAIGHAF